MYGDLWVLVSLKENTALCRGSANARSKINAESDPIRMACTLVLVPHPDVWDIYAPFLLMWDSIAKNFQQSRFHELCRVSGPQKASSRCLRPRSCEDIIADYFVLIQSSVDVHLHS